VTDSDSEVLREAQRHVEKCREEYKQRANAVSGRNARRNKDRANRASEEDAGRDVDIQAKRESHRDAGRYIK